MKLSELRNSYLNKEIGKVEYINMAYNFHNQLFEYSDFIKNTDISKIEILDDSIIITTRTNSTKFICNRDDKRTMPLEILNFGYYEKEELEVITNLIDNSFTILDIGGNIGWYAINIAKKFSKATIHTFEPITKTFTSLKKNLDLNKVVNVIPHNIGLSNEEKELDFFYYPNCTVATSLVDLFGESNVLKVSCHVRKLDDFVKENNLLIDFIKCDVEGAELFVFQGGINTIKCNKPIIFTEMLRKWSSKFNYHPNDIIKLLKDIGYNCFTINENYLENINTITDKTKSTNFIFLHAEKHINHINRLVKKG